jgi:hypothetical protein
VTELVSNSVKHGRAGPDDPVRLELVVSDRAVRVEVSDLGPGFTPTPQPKPAPGGMGGWGLIMVDRSASRWGTRHGGRCVWFELERNGWSPTQSSDGVSDVANNGGGLHHAGSTLPGGSAHCGPRSPRPMRA